MCKFLICHDMLRSECLLFLNINFVNSGKECKKAIIFLMNLSNYIEEENFDKNNENLKYYNDISGNLLQNFEVKDITSNLETNVNSLCQNLYVSFFCRKWEQMKCYAGRNKIFSSANIHQFLDFWTIFVRNNVNATGCYMCICFILHLAKLIATPSSF